MTCSICNEPINPEATSTYVEKTGWCKNRRQGGSNQISLPRTTGRYAHQHCVKLASKLGAEVDGQRSLL